jgi:hypothetical protein
MCTCSKSGVSMREALEIELQRKLDKVRDRWETTGPLASHVAGPIACHKRPAAACKLSGSLVLNADLTTGRDKLSFDCCSTQG